MKHNELIRYLMTRFVFQFLFLFLTFAVPNTHADTPVTGVISSGTLWGLSARVPR